MQSPLDTYCGQDEATEDNTSCPPDRSNICWEGYDEESTIYILSVPMTIALAVSSNFNIILRTNINSELFIDELAVSGEHYKDFGYQAQR